MRLRISSCHALPIAGGRELQETWGGAREGSGEEHLIVQEVMVEWMCLSFSLLMISGLPTAAAAAAVAVV